MSPPTKSAAPKGADLVKLTQDLIGRMQTILMSDACQSIDFMYDGFHVDGSGFAAVALALAGAYTMPLHTDKDALRVLAPRTAWPRSDQQRKGLTAMYAVNRNTFLIPEFTYAMQQLSEQQLIVHECTHCLFDMVSRRASEVNNEGAAYVAGAFFILNLGKRTSEGPTTVHGVAESIARRLAAAPGATVTAAEMTAMRTAIFANPAYAELKKDPTRELVGNGVPF